MIKRSAYAGSVAYPQALSPSPSPCSRSDSVKQPRTGPAARSDCGLRSCPLRRRTPGSIRPSHRRRGRCAAVHVEWHLIPKWVLTPSAHSPRYHFQNALRQGDARGDAVFLRLALFALLRDVRLVGRRRLRPLAIAFDRGEGTLFIGGRAGTWYFAQEDDTEFGNSCGLIHGVGLFIKHGL